MVSAASCGCSDHSGSGMGDLPCRFLFCPAKLGRGHRRPLAAVPLTQERRCEATAVVLGATASRLPAAPHAPSTTLRVVPSPAALRFAGAEIFYCQASDEIATFTLPLASATP